MLRNDFVSRGGQKLQYALDYFKIDVLGKICADLGCSTGGFTDCLLKNGAKKVYAIDTGYGVLDWKLRQDKKVVVMEKTNALFLELPEKVDFVSIDAGWTLQKKIIPQALNLLKGKGDIVSLLKSHYEAERKHLFKGKVKEEFLTEVLDKVKNDLKDKGVNIVGSVESPLIGQKGGNTEYLIWIKK
ncbi:MAG: SAM-dependent methyltransferase [Candidatus Portnoybacteria bacterium]